MSCCVVNKQENKEDAVSSVYRLENGSKDLIHISMTLETFHNYVLCTLMSRIEHKYFLTSIIYI